MFTTGGNDSLKSVHITKLIIPSMIFLSAKAIYIKRYRKYQKNNYTLTDVYITIEQRSKY